MTKKQIVRCVCFLLVTFMFIVLLCDLFEGENTQPYDQSMYTYRNMPENAVDAVFMGTSGVDRYWVSPKAYEETGIAVYPLAFEAFPAWLYTNFLDEVLYRHNPELILIDLRPFYVENISVKKMDVRARKYLDSLPFFSVNRIKTALKTMQVIREKDENQDVFDASYLFSIIKYHDKWAEEDYSIAKNLGSKDQIYGGFCIKSSKAIKRAAQKKTVFDADYFDELDPLSEKSLYEVLDYIKEKNLNVLFIDTPKFLDESEMGKVNTVHKILEENGMTYLHYYVDGSGDFSIELDAKRDFYDASHVNFYGAEKFTASLAEYLKENYDLPDKREDPAAQKFWDGKYDKAKDKIAAYEKKQAEKK